MQHWIYLTALQTPKAFCCFYLCVHGETIMQGFHPPCDTMRAGNHDRGEMWYLHWKLGARHLFCHDSPTKSQSDEASHATYPCWLQTSPKHQRSFLPTPSNHKASISVYSLNEAVRTPVFWELRWQISSTPFSARFKSAALREVTSVSLLHKERQH